MRARLLLPTLWAAGLFGCSTMQTGPTPTTVGAPAPTRRVRVIPQTPSPYAMACVDHPSVDRWENRLRRDRQRLKRIAALPEADRVRRLVVDAGLPESLAIIPILESSYRAHIHSHDGGAGLWQLQKPTARRFGLVVSKDNDERLDPDRSTRAAIRYLRRLHWHYHSWPLVLAAYNAGEGRVDRGLEARPRATVWDLAAHQHIPQRTAAYVGRFFAMARLLETTGPPC